MDFFRIASAPAIFQQTMDIILQRIPHTSCYIDTLITGVDDQERLTNLEEVLRCLQYHGITLKINKTAQNGLLYFRLIFFIL